MTKTLKMIPKLPVSARCITYYVRDKYGGRSELHECLVDEVVITSETLLEYLLVVFVAYVPSFIISLHLHQRNQICLHKITEIGQ